MRRPALRKLEELATARSQPSTPEPAAGQLGGDVVPVSIYLESDANAGAVEQAVLAVLYALDSCSTRRSLPWPALGFGR